MIAAVTSCISLYNTTPWHTFPRLYTPFSFSRTIPLLGAFHRTGSPMTKGRWHESSVRDGLHFRQCAGRAGNHRKTEPLSRPADQGRQRDDVERVPLGKADAGVQDQKERHSLLRRR